MLDSVVVGPLSQTISIAKVRQVFSAFITEKIILNNNLAYIRFTDPNDIESLDMKFPSLTIPELGNAPINLVPADFNWSLIDSETVKKESIPDEFMMGQKKQQKPTKLHPKFIVISDCDKKVLLFSTEEFIRKKLFSKYKVGRIIKYKQDLYIQFLDENEIETLQITFPGLQVRQLGTKASISPTDDNFSYDLVRSQVKNEQEQKYETEREEKRKKKEEAQIQEIRRGQQKRMKSDYYSSGWSVRPEGERESLMNLQKKSGNSELFWVLVVVIWGAYVTLM